MTVTTTNRRGFLKIGFVGSAVLTSGSMIASLSGCSRQPAITEGYKVLRPQDIAFLSAVIPVVVANFPGKLEQQGLDRVLRSFDGIVNNLGLHAHNELMKLFDAMSYAPVRLAAGAPWTDWAECTPEEIESFLINWQTSYIPLKRMGYISICKLSKLSWYYQPENFTESNYPGPPVKVPYSTMEID